MNFIVASVPPPLLGGQVNDDNRMQGGAKGGSVGSASAYTPALQRRLLRSPIRGGYLCPARGAGSTKARGGIGVATGRPAKASARIADHEERTSKAAALKDLSPHGQRLGRLAALAHDGPSATAQRQKLQALSAPSQSPVQLGKGKTPTGGGKVVPKVSEAELRNLYWLYLLQMLQAELEQVFPKNDRQPDSAYVAAKDKLMHPPDSGVKVSDHHTDTSGSGKQARHVSSNQLIGDVAEKIARLLKILQLSDVPDHCKSTSAWDTWRKDHDPGGGDGGGGLAV